MPRGPAQAYTAGVGTERIVIIGGGIAGLASAWWLARRGARDVVVVEREPVLGSQATAQNAAILRTAMPDDALEDLGLEGARFLAAPPAGFSAVPLLDPCGLLLVVEPGSTGERAWLARIARRHSSARFLDDAELARRAPHVRRAGARGVLFPGDGRVDVPALVAGFERGARAAGVRFELGARVTALLPQGRGVALADGRRIDAGVTVLAAGAWAASLARGAGSRLALRPTRRHLLVTRPDPAVDPRWPVVWRDDDPFYARPEAGGMLLSPCDEIAAEADTLRACATELAGVRAKAARHLAGVGGLEAVRWWAGLRTNAQDGRFTLGPDPDVPGLLWAAALGGHGITCAEPVGRIVADWVLDGACSHPLAAAFAPARFAAAPAAP